MSRRKAVASYVHNHVAPHLGKLGVLVALKSTGDTHKLHHLARELALHNRGQRRTGDRRQRRRSGDRAARKRAIFEDQIAGLWQAHNVIAKMVRGSHAQVLRGKDATEATLREKPDETIGSNAKAAEKDVGAPHSGRRLRALRPCEGIQKEETDFAAEVPPPRNPNQPRGFDVHSADLSPGSTQESPARR